MTQVVDASYTANVVALDKSIDELEGQFATARLFVWEAEALVPLYKSVDKTYDELTK